MCGIVGFVGEGSQEDLIRMSRNLVHRGPDDEGFYSDPDRGLYLGHRRLIIRDKVFGAQPMQTTDGNLCLVYNGEIYNAAELRTQLERKGYQFRSSHSDTEVLLHGYLEWGAQLPKHLNGMWAFALYDRKSRRLILSRDRFGEKPLFYTLQGKNFAFASELRALKKAGIGLSVSVKGVKKYFAYGYFPYTQTIYERVEKLPAGHNLIVDLDWLKPRVEEYWKYQIEPDYSKNESYWVEQIRDLLDAAVKRRLVTDVPLGIFLSGGLDSSAIAAFATKHLRAQSVKSFSVAFEEKSFDETHYAMEVSKFLGTEHSTITFDEKILGDLMQDLFSQLDEPLSDSSLMPYYLLCKHAKKSVTVALGGDAGDEIFAGYDTFRALKVEDWIQRIIPSPVHKGILNILGRLPISHQYMPLQFKVDRVKKCIGFRKALWNPLWLGPLSVKEISEMLNESVDLEDLYSEAIELWDSNDNPDHIDKALEFYGKLFLTDQILVKVDRMSMMHSLEVRSPFLDIDFIDCVRKIPNKYKLKGMRSGKYILKKAVEPYLPKRIVYRKKVGFSTPLSEWFARGLINYSSSSPQPFQSTSFAQLKFQEHQSKQKDNRLFLWNTHVLNQFFEKQQAKLPSSFEAKIKHLSLRSPI